MSEGRTEQPAPTREVRSGNRRIYHVHATRTPLRDKLQFIRRQWWIHNARVPSEQIIHESVPRWFLENYTRPDENIEWIYHNRERDQAVIRSESCSRLNTCLRACVNSLDSVEKKSSKLDIFLELVHIICEACDAMLRHCQK